MKFFFNILIVSGLILVPIVLIFLPANFFDDGQSICLSQLIAKIECFGCGLTRAVQHLIHLEFSQAYNYNKLSFIILPIGGYFWCKLLYKKIRILKK